MCISLHLQYITSHSAPSVPLRRTACPGCVPAPSGLESGSQLAPNGSEPPFQGRVSASPDSCHKWRTKNCRSCLVPEFATNATFVTSPRRLQEKVPSVVTRCASPTRVVPFCFVGPHLRSRRDHSRSPAGSRSDPPVSSTGAVRRVVFPYFVALGGSAQVRRSREKCVSQYRTLQGSPRLPLSSSPLEHQLSRGALYSLLPS